MGYIVARPNNRVTHCASAKTLESTLPDTVVSALADANYSSRNIYALAGQQYKRVI